MRKMLLIILAVLLLVFMGIFWYFFYYPKPFGYQIFPPRDYDECKEAGGEVKYFQDSFILETCNYKGKIFKLTNTL